MAIYSITTASAAGIVAEVFILDGVEISRSEYAAVQNAAFDRYYEEGYGAPAGA